MPDTETKTKICPQCKQEKSTDEFYQSKTYRDGCYRVCRQCISEYRKKNRKKVNERKRQQWQEKAKQARPEDLLHKEDIKKMRMDNVSIIPMRQSSDPDRYIPPADEKDKRKESLTKGYRWYKKCFDTAYGNLAALGLDEVTIKRFFQTGQTAFDAHTKFDIEADEQFKIACANMQGWLAREVLVKGLGFPYREEKIYFKRKQNKWVKTSKTIEKKLMPPNGSLLLAFMYNNFPDKWKNIHALLTGRLPTYDDNKRDRKKIASLARDVLGASASEADGEPCVSG